MMKWISVVLLVAIAGKLVSANQQPSFVENVRGPQRIVSGWVSEEGQHPHQVSLRMVNQNGGVSACGGSIINPKWLITAAHCTATRVTFVVRAGVVNLTRPEWIFESSEYYNHPLYNNALQSVVQPHDISLLKLGVVLTFSANVQPIRLQRSGDMERDYNGVRLVASGWGITWTGGSSPENMNWVYLVGDSYTRCRNAFGGSSIIVPSTICASAYNVTSQSTCSGDSGGPLTVVDDDGKISLVGVASFVSSQGCHAPLPAGFIQPGFYHDWYLEVTGINFDWKPTPEESGSNESGCDSEESGSNSNESGSDSKESGSDSKESGSDSKESGSNSRESGSNSKESGSNSKESGSNSKESGSNSKDSDSKSKESGSNSKESGSNSKDSGSNSKESGSNSKESGSNSKDSDSKSKESGSNSKESGSNSKESGSDSKDSDSHSSSSSDSSSSSSSDSSSSSSDSLSSKSSDSSSSSSSDSSSSSSSSDSSD